MFASRFYPDRMFVRRYFPEVGAPLPLLVVRFPAGKRVASVGAADLVVDGRGPARKRVASVGVVDLVVGGRGPASSTTQGREYQIED
jgi:hypothetical protein